MSSYIGLLQEELRRVGMKCRLEKSDFRLSQLKGKQRWFKGIREIEDRRDCNALRISPYVLKIPVVYFRAGDEGYFFLDLEELYEDIIKEHKKRHTLYIISEYAIGDPGVLYANYKIFGEYSSEIGQRPEITAKEFLDRWYKYGLDFAILIHEFDCEHPGDKIKYRIRKHIFEFKDIYLQHSVNENGKYLTVSFVASILEGFQTLWRRFGQFPGIKRIGITIFTKTQFLNLVENKIIAPFYENVFGTKYKPLVDLKDHKERAKRIIEILNKIADKA